MKRKHKSAYLSLFHHIRVWEVLPLAYPWRVQGLPFTMAKGWLVVKISYIGYYIIIVQQMDINHPLNLQQGSHVMCQARLRTHVPKARWPPGDFPR
jgi:hypothetical protein